MTDHTTRRLLAGLVGLCALLVLAGCLGGLQVPGSTPEPSPDLAFEDATEESGLDYVDVLSGRSGNGNASVYAADVDRDGWTDLLTTGGTEPVVWRNAEGTFERAGALPDVDGPIKSASFVDYDDDGWEDLLVFPEYGQPVAMHNDEGSFESDDVGLGELKYPLGAAAADYDGDGDRDLFVYQSGDWKASKPAGYLAINGTLEEDNGHRNHLYENVDGEFERVDDAGIEGSRWSLAASFVDLNDDGHPDIHVANDYNSDVVYRNQGDGSFDQRLLMGNTARNGMASEIGDFDANGHPDVFTTNIDLPLNQESIDPERYETLKRLFGNVIHSGRTEGNTVMLNRGNGTFDERAAAMGIQEGGWGWAASHVDLNNDGQDDLFHTTQNVVRIDTNDPFYTYPMVWERTGENFTRLTASEIGFNEDDGRGSVALDYDRDGRMDVVSANYVSQYTVYENTANSSDTNALQFLAVDDNGAAAYGATIEVDAGYASRTVSQHGRTDYLSQEPRENHVGLGAHESASLHVTWPDGTEQSFEDVPAGQYVHLQKDGTVETVVEFDG